MAQLDFTTRGRDLGQQPASLLLLDSSLTGIRFRGENLTELRSTRIRIASLDRAAGKENLIGFLPKLPFEEKPAASKLDVPCLAAQEKYLVLTTPKKAHRPRRWKRAGRVLPDNPLDLDVNFLVLATGYSLGIVFKNLDQRPLRSSFIASKCSMGSKISGQWDAKRFRAKDFGLGGVACRKHRKTIRTNKGEDSFCESYLITSNAGDALSNNRLKIMSRIYDGYQSDDRRSEEVQSAYKNVSGGDEEIRGFVNLDETEERSEENEWSWVPQENDSLAESISSLDKTQEVLERFFKKNDVFEMEMQKLAELGMEFTADDSRALPDVEADVLGMDQKMKHLEQKLKEASDTFTEKDSRLSELQLLIDDAHAPTPQETAPINIDQLEMELEGHLQGKIEAEIQCLVMAKARRSWQVRAEDQIALGEHKLSATEDTRMLLKLQDTEKKIVMLKEQVDRLEAHEKELSVTTEVLRMQSRTFKIGLCGLLQLVMLCISLKMFFSQDSARFGDLVPT
ncbi:unnamed protein product [Alopecurus aequalis]